MNGKTTLFAYLRGALVGEIETGRIRCGESLPSAKKLCERYRVGIRTVRDVLAALREEGYIKTEERRCAVVIYREDVSRENQRAICALLARRSSVMEMYQTLAVLAPPIFSFGARCCGERVLRQLQRGYQKAGADSPKENWRASSAALHRLLAHCGSPLLGELYSSMELYTQVPVFEGYQNPYLEAIRHDPAGFSTALAALEEGPPERVEQCFAQMYQNVGLQVGQYLQALAADYPQVGEDPASAFRWDAEKGRVYTYTEIGRDLLDGIRAGIYPDGGFLPPAAVLAQRYGVSLSTLRQALEMLRQLGLVEVYNGRGTQVTLGRMQLSEESICQAGNRRDALLYLQGMQFMVLVLPRVAHLAFPHVEREVAQRVTEAAKGGGKSPLAPLIAAVIEAVPLASLRQIVEQTNRLLQRGAFLFYLQGRRAQRNIRAAFHTCVEAADALQAGDEAVFVQKLTDSYRLILERARQRFIEAGLPGAAEIVLP